MSGTIIIRRRPKYQPQNTPVTMVTSYDLQGNLHERHHHHQQTSLISATKHTSNRGNFLCFYRETCMSGTTIISRHPLYPLQNTQVTMVNLLWFLQGKLAWATPSSDSSSADFPQYPPQNTPVTMETSYVLQGNLHERHHHLIHHQQTSPISAHKTHQ